MEKFRINMKNKLLRFFSSVKTGDALYLLFLYVFSFLMTTTQYFFAGNPYPIGYDTVNHLLEMTKVDRYGIAKTIFPFSPKIERLLIHPGYILIANGIHALFGFSYFTIEKFLPSLLSAFLPIVFYIIVFVYTGNRRSAVICGFVGTIYYGRLRFTQDLRPFLIAFLLFSLVILFMINRFKDEGFWKDLSSKHRKEKMLDFLRLLKSKSSLSILFLLFCMAYMHIELFIVGVIILLTAVIIHIFRVVFSTHKSVHIHILWLITLPAIVILSPILLLRNTAFIYIKWFFHQVTALSPEAHVPLTISNLLFNFTFGAIEFVAPVIVSAYEFVVPTLFSFPFDILVICFSVYAGLIVIFRLILSSKNSFEADTSSILFSWLLVPFLMSFAIYFGLRIDHLRSIVIMPTPIAASIGLNYIIERVYATSHALTRLDARTRVFNFNLVKVLGILVILLLLLNSSLYSLNYSATRPSYIDSKVASELEWLIRNYPTDKVPVFIVDLKTGYLVNTVVIEVFMGDFYKDLYDVDEHPKGVYFGKIAYFIEEEYTPYEGRILDGDIWGEGYVSRPLYSNYSLNLLKEKLGPNLASYDVFLLTSTAPDRSYIFNDYERSMVNEIHDGIFMLRKDLFELKHTISTCDSASGWSITSGNGSITLDTTEKKEGEASINLNFNDGYNLSSNYVYSVRYEVPETSRGLFSEAEFLQLSIKLESITHFNKTRISLVDTDSNYKCWNSASILSTSWNYLFIPLKSEPAYATQTPLNMSDINYINIEVWYPANGAQTFWLDNVLIIGPHN